MNGCLTSVLTMQRSIGTKHSRHAKQPSARTPLFARARGTLRLSRPAVRALQPYYSDPHGEEPRAARRLEPWPHAPHLPPSFETRSFGPLLWMRSASRHLPLPRAGPLARGRRKRFCANGTEGLRIVIRVGLRVFKDLDGRAARICRASRPMGVATRIVITSAGLLPERPSPNDSLYLFRYASIHLVVCSHMLLTLQAMGWG